MKPGIYKIPDHEYFAAEGINSSFLKTMLISPAHAKYKKDNPKDPSPAMQKGTALHCAVLEPDEFLKRYAILPDNAPKKPTETMIKAAKPSKDVAERIQFWNVFSKESQGKIIISNEEAAEYLHIGSLVRNHPELKLFFNGGQGEMAVFGNDPDTGLLCKCKPDYLNKVSKYKVMLEFKTTQDARPQFFNRIAHNFGYYQSAAFYPDVMEWAGLGRPDLYLIIAVETEAPYGIQVYEVPDEAMDFGRRQYRKALDLYAYCLETGEWPNYDTAIQLLSLPTWAREE